ncbi:MAG: hypothetical protein ACYCYI_00035 [Saccharofermentanales bacterium]
MRKYTINPDIKNFDDPLFIWYLIFADMSQNFSSIHDIGKKFNRKSNSRAFKFLCRIGLAYTSEAQKTIRQFILSPTYKNTFRNLLNPETLKEFDKLYNQWENYINNDEWKFLNAVRDDVFHFAADNSGVESYKIKFKNFVTEKEEQPNLSLNIFEYRKNCEVFLDDSFCDVLWFYNIEVAYKKIKEKINFNENKYAKDVSDKLIQALNLSTEFILFMRNFLESYFIYRKIIVKI